MSPASIDVGNSPESALSIIATQPRLWVRVCCLSASHIPEKDGDLRKCYPIYAFLSLNFQQEFRKSYGY
jgi:hypothetical protein